MANLAFGVDSTLQLYTTVVGWHQFNALWDVITSTGLVFLPFFGIILRNFIEPIKSQQAQSAGLTSLKRLEVEVITAFIILLLAGQPLISLSMQELSHTARCSDDGRLINQQVTTETDKGSYKSVFMVLSDMQNAKVPVWWYAVISVGSGLVNAAKTGLPCEADSRLIRAKVSNIVISDDNLRLDVSKFLNDCYSPTHQFVKYYKDRFKDGTKWGEQQYNRLLNEGGSDSGKYQSRELFRIGSMIFLEMEGAYFYQGRKVTSKVTGFGDTQPTCFEWWGGDALVKNFDEAYLKMDGSKHLWKRLVDGRVKSKLLKKDIVKNNKQLIKTQKLNDGVNELVKFSFNVSPEKVSQSAADHDETVFGLINSAASVYGFIRGSIEHYPMIAAIRQATLVALPIVEMAVFIMLPLALVFSGYSIKFLTTATFGLIVVKFLFYIFYMNLWIDNQLLKALGVDESWHFFNFSEHVIAYSISTVYWIIPLVLVSILGWAGLDVASGIVRTFDRLAGPQSNTAQAGKSAGQFVNRQIDQAVSGKSGSPGPKDKGKK